MAITLTTAPPDPVAGQSGHFAAHVWLRTSIQTLAANAIPTASHTPPAVNVSGMAAGDLKTIATALLDLGIITQST